MPPTNRRSTIPGPQELAPVIFTTRYEIRSSGGEHIATHVRRDRSDGDKEFHWVRPNGAPGLAGTPPTSLPLYGTEHLRDLSDGTEIFVTEGEKATDALRAQGVHSLGTVTGASKGGKPPDPTVLEPLLRFKLYPWPDNDKDGEAHMKTICDALFQIGHRETHLIRWPEAPDKGDAADYFAAGGTSEGVQVLSASATRWSPTQPNGDDPSFPNVVRLLDVEPEEITWLWERFIPLGKLTVLEGDPGVGKSFICMALAAALSTGRGLPGAGDGAPQNVLVASAEDGLADTIRPRLDRLDADTSRVFALDGQFTLDGSGLTWLDRQVEIFQPVLVIIDPLVAYMGAKTDTYRANQIRAILAPLAAMAQRRQCVVIAVRHLTKGGSTNIMYRGQGSIDITAAARSVLLAGRDPKEESQCALIPIKSNFARTGVGEGYSLAEGRFEWTGTSNLTAEKILGSPQYRAGGGKLDEAISFLETELADGHKAATEMVDWAQELGISKRTLDRAKAKLRVVSRREGLTGSRGGGRIWWSLDRHPKNGDVNAEEPVGPEGGLTPPIRVGGDLGDVDQQIPATSRYEEGQL